MGVLKSLADATRELGLLLPLGVAALILALITWRRPARTVAVVALTTLAATVVAGGMQAASSWGYLRGVNADPSRAGSVPPGMKATLLLSAPSLTIGFTLAVAALCALLLGLAAARARARNAT